MKKKVESHTPSPASLRAVPPVDFAAYKRGKRNPFAARVKADGWSLEHPSPALASLREIPELGSSAVGRANPYAKRIKADGCNLQVGRGRPTAGAEVGPTTVKSVRLPPAIWERLEKRANVEGVALHALIRAALVELIDGRPRRRRTG